MKDRAVEDIQAASSPETSRSNDPQPNASRRLHSSYPTTHLGDRVAVETPSSPLPALTSSFSIVTATAAAAVPPSSLLAAPLTDFTAANAAPPNASPHAPLNHPHRVPHTHLLVTPSHAAAATSAAGPAGEITAAAERRPRRGSALRRRSNSRGCPAVGWETSERSVDQRADTSPGPLSMIAGEAVPAQSGESVLVTPALAEAVGFESTASASRIASRSAMAITTTVSHAFADHHPSSRGSGGDGPSHPLLLSSQAVPRRPTALHSAPSVVVKAHRKPIALSEHVYRLLRLCFLRRWSWHLWRLWARLLGGNGCDEMNEDDGDDDGASSVRGEEGEMGLEEGDAESSDGRLRSATHLGAMRREGVVDGDDGDSASWSTLRAAPLGDTRRRGRGPAVSPSAGGDDDRPRRRGRHVGLSSRSDRTSSSGETKGWSTAAVVRLFLAFFCCCCCCPGGPCDHRAGWVARAMHSLRVLWTRHRPLLACLVILLLLFNYLVMLPLLTAATVAVLESEDVFVERMRLFGLPREVGPVSAPRAVAVFGLSEATPVAAKARGPGGTLQGAARAHHNHPAATPVPMTPSFSSFFGRRTVEAAQLPSWTLFPLTPNCIECVENGAFAAAVATSPVLPVPEGSPSSVVRGVYATTTAPLGRIGPMLLAIASVTDDVVLTAELAKWPWVPRVVRSSEVLLRSRQGAPPAHLAVLGIPSMDSGARAELRRAQRATWMTYSDVARAENDFTGRLLVLYVLAASERAHVRTSRETGVAAGAGPPADYVCSDALRLRSDPSVLLPTAAEYADAVSFHAAAAAAAAAAPAVVVEGNEKDTPASFVRRRMRLWKGWEQSESSGSPCDAIVDIILSAGDARERAANASTPLSFLAQSLELPVSPLYTAPATLICHASAALWQEALEHRNVLWVDMMTDRRPTSKKKMGEGGNWGLPVEVGMSQKLILWLAYAYHAFPDVSFIVKGDDDTYLKVPQYVNDIQYMQRGRSRRPLEELTREDGAGGPRGLRWVRRAFSSAAPSKDYLRTRATEECVYWGSMRRWNGEVYFGAGMMFLMHRRLVQTVLEDRPEYNNDVVRLATQDYQPRYAHSYFAAMMDHEDVMVGKILAERRVRAQQLCPFYRAWYIWETWERFHDVHFGRVRNVTWSTTVAHRCTTADLSYLHFYFQHEYRYGRAPAVAEAEKEDAAARAAAAAWLEAQQANRTEKDAVTLTSQQQRQTTPSTTDTLASVLWSVPAAMNHTPLPYVRSVRDGVAVYEVEYSPFADGFLVLDGWVANTRRRSSQH